MTVDPYGQEREQNLAAYEARRRPATRASDADRERTVQQLQQHMAEGRLDYEEFSGRVDEAYASRTMDDLAHALRELPHVPVRASGSSPAAPRSNPLERVDEARARAVALGVNISIYVVVNVGLLLIWLFSSIEEGELEFFWPMFPLFFWGMAIVAQAVELRRRRR